ncbi:hypothetical protein, variant [Phialophora macrospora]|uniref:Mid2 domain-containing protein n=1 Tax=Phialophora macrospora TaxID=1851006 RepID=A0A0D2FTZ9_9EURO|nr:hypothetical protein, variant [Phialophora macrospora]
MTIARLTIRPSQRMQVLARRVCCHMKGRLCWETVRTPRLAGIGANEIVLNAMQSACDHQPDASLGQTVAFQRDLFNTTTVGTATTPSMTTSSATSKITSSTSSATTTTGPASTPPPAASSDPISTAPSTQQTSQSSSPGLGPGAAAGIGVGCGLGAIALTAGFGWFILDRRRRKRHALSHEKAFQFKDSESALLSVSHHQPVPLYAQQLASRELYEIESRQSGNWRSELDGRPVH